MSGSAVFDASGVGEGLSPLRLTVEGGGCDGRSLTVRSEVCVVGSARDCNLRLAASAPEYVCELVRGVDGASVRSRFPQVRLNGESFDEAPLNAGDRISIGDVSIVVGDERDCEGAAVRRRERFPKAWTSRSARVDGAFLLGELRRLQQELREVAGSDREDVARRRDGNEPAQENELAESLRALLDSERAETERLSERLAASHREREELERRVSELDDALRHAREGSQAAAEEREEAEQARVDAARAEIDSLRGMLGDAQDELEQMRRVYDARLERAREMADEERLAAVTRAVEEAEERFAIERDRSAGLEAERVAALQARVQELDSLRVRLAELEAQQSKLAELEAQQRQLAETEEQLAALKELLARSEREAEERRAAAVEEAKRETEQRLASELEQRLADAVQAAEADLANERELLERERTEFADRQRAWDEERAEYERLATEQTALIAEKQRELRDAQERLSSAEQAAQATPDSSYVDVDRQAWEEEKAAFEELARCRMEELAEKTRQVEERLRAAAEKQRLEIQREREALAREREEARRDDSRAPGLADYFEAEPESLPDPSFEPVASLVSECEEPTAIEDAEAPVRDEDDEAPRRGGFRFFGDLNDDAPVDVTMPMAKYDLSDVPDELDVVDAEEAERMRLIAEDRLARFAPRQDRAEDEPPNEGAAFAARSHVGEASDREPPQSGFLLRDFLDQDESPLEESRSIESCEGGDVEEVAAREPEPPASVADVLARMGRQADFDDELTASLEEHSFEAPSFDRSVETPPTVEVAPPGAAGPADEDSIEDYMQSLLRRVRGESAAQLTEPVQDVRRTTMLRPEAPAPDPVEEDKPVVPLTESEFTPRSEAPEQTDKLSAMRELANASTRSAIFSSVVRRTYGKAATAAALSALAALIGAGALWLGAQGNLLVVAAGLLGWVVAGFFGFRAWKSWKELRKIAAPLKGR